MSIRLHSHNCNSLWYNVPNPIEYATSIRFHLGDRPEAMEIAHGLNADKWQKQLE